MPACTHITAHSKFAQVCSYRAHRTSREARHKSGSADTSYEVLTHARACVCSSSVSRVLLVAAFKCYWVHSWFQYVIHAAAASDCGSSLVAALLVYAEEESVGELRLAHPPQVQYKFQTKDLVSFYELKCPPGSARFRVSRP